MDWAAVARDVFGGLLIAGALAAGVPDSFWRSLFFEHHHTPRCFPDPLSSDLLNDDHSVNERK